MASQRTKKLLSQAIAEDFTASPESNYEKENSKPASKRKAILGTPNPQASPFPKAALATKGKSATLGNLLKLTVGLPDPKTTTPSVSSSTTPSTRLERPTSAPASKSIINPLAAPPVTPVSSKQLISSDGTSAKSATAHEQEEETIVHRKPKKKHIVEDDDDQPLSSSVSTAPSSVASLSTECSDPNRIAASVEKPITQADVEAHEAVRIDDATPQKTESAASEKNVVVHDEVGASSEVVADQLEAVLEAKQTAETVETTEEKKLIESAAEVSSQTPLVVEKRVQLKTEPATTSPPAPSLDPIAAEAERVRIAKEEEDQRRKKELISQLTKQQRHEYNELVSEARTLEKQDATSEALEKYKKAHSIFPHDDRLVKKMTALEAIIADEKANTVQLSDGWIWHKKRSEYALDTRLRIPSTIYEKLFPYQREGVKWLWSLHKLNEGGILGDDMGLGKTIQVSSFIGGLFASDLAKRVLILMPVSVIENWKVELSKWAPDVRVKLYHGTSTVQRDAELSIVARKGGVCLSTYGMVVSAHEKLCENDLEWDYIILDEGHKIKNPSIKLSKTLPLIRSRHRVVLTGSPIQNNLQEMWALFDYACEGRLLGDSLSFKQQWEGPIILAQDKSATPFQVEKGLQLAEKYGDYSNWLRKLIEPFFLRREKKDVFAHKEENKDETDNDSPSAAADSEGVSEITAPPSMSRSQSQTLTCRKNDFIVWLPLSDVQQKLYADFLSTSDIKKILNKTASPLAAITVLKKICDHPMLLHDDMSSLKEIELSSAVPVARDVRSIVVQSGKLSFVQKLLTNLFEEGHRVLIFSQSRMMLNLVEKILSDYKFLRIDGTISKTAERQRLINLFNADHSYFCFLLTTGVGGLGINLTSADRVIIIDPAWTPIDDQAVDRVYRIGQTKNVVVYRLITCGTIEEKIYRKQVFKASLMKTVIELNEHSHRYFTAQELSELFQLDNTNYSATQKQLEAMHAQKRVTDVQLDRHLEFLSSLGMFGVSDHNLLFTASDWVPESIEGGAGEKEIARSEAEDAHLELMRTVSGGSDSKGSSSSSVPGTAPGKGLSSSSSSSSGNSKVTGRRKRNRKAKGQFVYRSKSVDELSDTSKERYDEELDNARCAEKREDQLLALEYYFEALKIYDGDVKLHHKILRLAHRCQLLSLTAAAADDPCEDAEEEQEDEQEEDE